MTRTGSHWSDCAAHSGPAYPSEPCTCDGNAPVGPERCGCSACSPVQDFSQHPVSLAEVRSDRTRSAADWTPRDVLIAALRQIDQGEIAPETLVVCWSRITGKGTRDNGWIAASGDPLLTEGLLCRTARLVTGGT